MKKINWLNEKPKNAKATISELMTRKKDHNPGIKTIYLFLTRKCNLGCSHCYINGVGPKARDNDFSFETIKKTIEEVIPFGLKKIKVSGGEPMIHKDFNQLINYLGSLGLDEIVLETNGTLISDTQIVELENINNLKIYISLDHISEEKHDEFRKKKGAFSRTVDVLKKIGSTNITSVVTTTAYKNNYQIITEIINSVLSWGISKHRTLLNIHPLGNALEHLDNAITINECVSLVQSILKSDHFKSGKAYLTLPPALMPLNHLKEINSCGWGEEVVGILSNGDVSMCSASYDDPNMIGGNIYDDNLISIWNNSSFFKNLRLINRKKVKGVCSNCAFYESCRGVCKMSSYSHYGEKDAPYPLCQEFYNLGLFPEYALLDSKKDCTYKKDTISFDRNNCNSKVTQILERLSEIENNINNGEI